MVEAALYAALGCAACSALTGNRTACVLLASVAFCLTLDEAGVPFSFVRWLIFDTLAMSLILLFSRLDRADWVIFALFFVGWASYCLPDPHRYIASVAVTIIQLLLTFRPTESREALNRLVARWKANFRHRDEWTDLRARGADG